MSTLIVLCLVGVMFPAGVSTEADADAPTLALVEQLGSDVWRERRKAEGALVALGPAAVPTLRRALEETDDAETAACIESALARIAAESQEGATRITVTFDDTPLDQVLASLSEQTGMSIGLHPPDLADKQNLPRITADYAGEPLWNVMRDLRDQTQLYLRPGRTGLLLCNRAWQAVSSGPTSIDGAFLVELREIRRERSVKFDAVRLAEHAAKDIRGTFGIELHVHAEPKLILAHRDLVVTVDQALDDRGNDLRRKLQPDCQRAVTGGFVVKLPLLHPEMRRLGERIEKLEGKITATTLCGWHPIEALLDEQTVTAPVSDWRASIEPIRQIGDRRFGVTLSMTVPHDSVMSSEDLFARVDIIDTAGRTMRLRDVERERTPEKRRGQPLRHRYVYTAVVEAALNGPSREVIEPGRIVWHVPTEQRPLEAKFEFEALPIP
ncbi:MAG: hypothetical protein AAF743_14405 [Planctomycetota bacterium]